MSAKKKTKTNLVRSIERYAGKTERWIKNPVPTSGNKSSRGVVFSIRFAIDELENLKERAELQGLSISGLIKRELFEPSKTT